MGGAEGGAQLPRLGAAGAAGAAGARGRKRARPARAAGDSGGAAARAAVLERARAVVEAAAKVEGGGAGGNEDELEEGEDGFGEGGSLLEGARARVAARGRGGPQIVSSELHSSASSVLGGYEPGSSPGVTPGVASSVAPGSRAALLLSPQQRLPELAGGAWDDDAGASTPRDAALLSLASRDGSLEQEQERTVLLSRERGSRTIGVHGSDGRGSSRPGSAGSLHPLRPPSRALSAALRALESAESSYVARSRSRAAPSLSADERERIMTPLQKRRRHEFQGLLGEVRNLASRGSGGGGAASSRAGTAPTASGVTPWRSTWSAYRHSVPNVPFGRLAFEGLSWKPAQGLDLRLWANVVDDESLLLVAEQCGAALRLLDLRGCWLVTDEGLRRVLDRCRGVEELRLAGCASLTDAGVEEAARKLGAGLLVLDLCREYELTRERDAAQLCRCCDRSFFDDAYFVLRNSGREGGFGGGLGTDLSCFFSSRDSGGNSSSGALQALSSPGARALALNERSLKVVAKHCPSLRELLLDWQQSAATNESLQALAVGCRKVSSLSVVGCSRMAQEALKVVGPQWSAALQSARLARCERVDDSGLCNLIGQSAALRELDLGHLPRLTDAGVRTLLESKVVWGYKQHGGFLQLSRVRLAGCAQLTDLSLSWIASGCPNLESIDLAGCTGLRDFGLRALANLKHLLELDLSHCSQISDAGLRHLVSPVLLDETRTGTAGSAVPGCGTASRTTRSSRRRRQPSVPQVDDCDEVEIRPQDLLEDELGGGGGGGGGGDDDDDEQKEQQQQRQLQQQRHLQQQQQQQRRQDSALPSLRRLALCGLVVTSSGLTVLVEALGTKRGGSLAELDLSGIPSVTDALLRCIAANLGTQLLALAVSASDQVSAAGLGALGQRCRYLRRLRIPLCGCVGDDAVRALQSLRHVEELDLSRCRSLTAAGCAAAVPNWRLRCLSLAGLPVGEAELLPLLRLCQELKALDLRDCASVGDSLLRALTDADCGVAPGLNTLNLLGCRDVSDGAVEALAAHLRGAKGLAVCALRAEGFRGVAPDPAARLRHHQGNAVALERRRLRAVVVMQCWARCVAARSARRHLAIADWLRRNEAAVQMQRAARGFLARVFVSQLRAELTTLAIGTQRLWRKYWARKLLARAAGHWRHAALGRVFNAWAAEANRERWARQERRAREIWEKAISHSRTATKARAVQTWREYKEQCRWEKARYPKAIELFFRTAARRTVVAWWHDVTAPAIRRRNMLRAVWLNCVPLETRNAANARSAISAAARCRDRALKRAHFNLLKRAVRRARENMETAIAFHQDNFFFTPQTIGLSSFFEEDPALIAASPKHTTDSSSSSSSKSSSSNGGGRADDSAAERQAAGDVAAKQRPANEAAIKGAPAHEGAGERQLRNDGTASPATSRSDAVIDTTRAASRCATNTHRRLTAKQEWERQQAEIRWLCNSRRALGDDPEMSQLQPQLQLQPQSEPKPQPQSQPQQAVTRSSEPVDPAMDGCELTTAVRHEPYRGPGVGWLICRWWRRYAARRIDLRCKQSAGSMLTVRRKEKRAVNALLRQAHMRRVQKLGKVAARLHFAASLKARAMRLWRGGVAAQKAMRAKWARAVAHHLRRTQARIFQRWWRFSLATKDTKTKIARSLARMRWRQQARIFAAWRGVVARRRFVLCRSVQRSRLRCVARVLALWRELAEKSFAQRERQLLEWQRLNRAAVLIQARWRGGRGREAMEDFRLMSQLMAVKMQGAARRWLARRARAKCVRYRVLQEYVVAERETDAMAAEDADGVLMRKEYRAARVVQMHFRSRHAREWAFEARREMGRLREKRRRDKQAEVAVAAAAAEAERAKELASRNLRAAKVQAAWRGHTARLAYARLWVRNFDFQAAALIQRTFRARRARLLLAAARRHRRVLEEANEQARLSGKVMRAIMLRSKMQQQLAMRPLQYLGLHPDTFTLDLRKLSKETWNDRRDWMLVARSHFEAVRLGGLDASKRHEVLEAFNERMADKERVRKGDAVRVTYRNSPYAGHTGIVLDIREAPSVPGNYLAGVKLDSTGEVVFIPAMTPQTAEENSHWALSRVPALKKDYAASKVTAPLVRDNRENLLRYAEAAAAELALHRAAITVQRHYRGLRLRRFYLQESVKQRAIDAERQAKLLALLRRLHLDSARTGRVLVAAGLVWPRYIPDMPERHNALELWFERRRMFKELRAYCDKKLREGVRERRARTQVLAHNLAMKEESLARAGAAANKLTRVHVPAYKVSEAMGQLNSVAGFNAGKMLEDNEQARMRWRIRSHLRYALSSVLCYVTDRLLAPAAEALDRQAHRLTTPSALEHANARRRVSRFDAPIGRKGDTPNVGAVRQGLASLLSVLAKVTGGPEWRRSPQERLTWVGTVWFEQLEASPHVSLGGYGVYHGTWSNSGKPEGCGLVEFPQGKGLQRILKQYASMFADQLSDADFYGDPRPHSPYSPHSPHSPHSPTQRRVSSLSTVHRGVTTLLLAPGRRRSRAVRQREALLLSGGGFNDVTVESLNEDDSQLKRTKEATLKKEEEEEELIVFTDSEDEAEYLRANGAGSVGSAPLSNVTYEVGITLADLELSSELDLASASHAADAVADAATGLVPAAALEQNVTAMQASEPLHISKIVRAATTRSPNKAAGRKGGRQKGAGANLKAPQYGVLAANFIDGRITGEIVMRFAGGQLYEGPYVEEEHAAALNRMALSERNPFAAFELERTKPMSRRARNTATAGAGGGTPLGEEQPANAPVLETTNPGAANNAPEELLPGSGGALGVPQIKSTSSVWQAAASPSSPANGGALVEALAQQQQQQSARPAWVASAGTARFSDDEFGASSHFGVWHTANGKVFEGPGVTNHFLEDDANGLFRYVTPAGDVYFGELVHSIKQGKGRMLYKNGDEYEGEWLADLPHGRGSYRWAGHAAAYVGDFERGKPHGLGRQVFASGSRYEGGLARGLFHGLGRLKRANGDMYEGAFELGHYHGLGELRYGDGVASYSGGWRNGRRHTMSGVKAKWTDRKGDRYEVGFVDDLLDGEGWVVEASARWPVEKHGVWQRGELLHWVGVSVNEGSTNEFCEKFKTYGDYSSYYALLVSRTLPELPNGVDPDDRRVEQHVDGIMRRAGPLAGVAVIKRCEAALEAAKPEMQEALTAKSAALKCKEQALREFEAQCMLVEELEQRTHALRARADEIAREVRLYWTRPIVDGKENEAQRRKRAYKRAVAVLKRFEYTEWFACKMATFTPLLWHNMWTGIAALLLRELSLARPPTPADVDRLCNGSEINAELGEANAKLRKYKVKLLDEVAFFDVYERCRSAYAITEASKAAYHRDMKANNVELSAVCKLAGPLVTFLSAALEYVKAAVAIAPIVETLRATRERLEFERGRLRDAYQVARAKEAAMRKATGEASQASFVYELAASRFHEVELTLERAHRVAAVAAAADTKGKLLHKFTDAWERDEDPIFPWISREDEHIRDECRSCIDWMVGMCADIEPEVWDLMTTLRELVVARVAYQVEYKTPEEHPDFVPQQVRELLGEVVNQVAGCPLAEPQVVDLLDQIIFQIEGPQPELKSWFDDLLGNTETRANYDRRAVERNRKFAGKRVSVALSSAPGGGGAGTRRRFGLCLATYDYQRPVMAKPEPGTGLIYVDESADVFGFEDTCRFLSELRPGVDLLVLPALDGSQDVLERPVAAVLADYQLQLGRPFERRAVPGTWTKNWALRRPDRVAEYIDTEAIDVRYDNGEEERAVALDRVILAPDPNATAEQDDAAQKAEAEEAKRRAAANAARLAAMISSDDSDDDAEQPEIWEEFVDSATELLYWHCHKGRPKGETTWEPPDGPHVWLQYADDDETGFLYWHNPATGETTWLEP